MQWTPIWHQAITKSLFSGKLFGKNNTVVFSVKSPVEGISVRLRFSNIYGKDDYKLKVTANGTDVTLNGEQEMIIPQGHTVYSDEIPFTIKAEDEVYLKIYYENPIADMNMIEAKASLYSGDLTETEITDTVIHKPYLAKKLGVYNAVPSLDLMEIQSDVPSKSIVAFGDSITALSRWTKPLADRLYKEYQGEYILLNSGISGNCLLYERPDLLGELFGEMGTKRFERDVLSIPHVSAVIFALGINDIAYYTEKTKEIINLERFKAAVTNIVQRLHNRSIRVTAMTITPRLGVARIMGKYTPAMEEQRLLFNEWLRSTDLFDYVYDAEALVREEHSDGYYYQESLQQGDRLHPNKEGGRLLAEGFDLKQITGR